MKIDLHSHSTASDGTYSPQEVVSLAKTHGIEMFALTDHDTLAGYLAVRDTVPSGMRLIAGVEISTTHTLSGGYGGRKKTEPTKNVSKSIHVVALDVKDYTRMQTALQAVQDDRANRGRAMVEKLGEQFPQIGFDALWEQVLSKVGGDTISLGRPHIAQALCEFGVVRTVTEAFDKYLGEGKSAYVPLATPTMAQAVSLIHDCGGLAVLAHPTRYGLSATRVRKLIGDFADCGGDGCELPSPTEPISTRQMVDRTIALHGLLVSVGSDFHGTITPWRKLGQVATLKAEQLGIWTKFAC